MSKKTCTSGYIQLACDPHKTNLTFWNFLETHLYRNFPDGESINELCLNPKISPWEISYIAKIVVSCALKEVCYSDYITKQEKVQLMVSETVGSNRKG